MNKDLTVGSPAKVIVGFTLPMFISVVFQQLYNIADSIIAGKYANGLAAVGASYPITMLFMSVALGCQIGCSVVIGRNYGAKNYKAAKTCITTSLIAGLVLSAVLTALGVIFSPQLMKLVNTPDEIFADGNTYLRIYTGGFIFLFLYNVATGIFNSLGDSRTPLYLLISSSVGNVALDALFTIVFKWGVAGVAWATFIAQGTACICALIILMRRLKKVYDGKDAPLFDKQALREIGVISLPSVLQQSFVSVGNLFIQSLVNGYGATVIEGYSAAVKLNTFAITVFATVGNGISSFTAQNNGAGRPDRIRKGLMAGIVFALVIAGLFFGLYFFLPKTFVGMFMNEGSSEEAINTGIEFLKTVAPFYFVICLKLACDGVFRGAEKMGLFMLSTFIDLALRVISAFVLSGIMGASGIWNAWPSSWVVGSIIAVICCFNYLRKAIDSTKASEA
ncbi:MAG: MATE family efflux transporter [Oscillospiraceae bacterium]